MIIWGINAMNHDASIAVVDSETRNILFAGHAERYSRIKNDTELNSDLILNAKQYGNPDLIVWFENPWGRKVRQVRSGQLDLVLSECLPEKYLERFGITGVPIKYSNHHASHAAGGFFTSGFHQAAILVIDAIGEMTTASIWEGKNNKLTKKWSLNYPHSVGLFYSAITALVGLKPNEEEYILMGMAAYGTLDTELLEHISKVYFKDDEFITQRFNFHKGIYHDDVLTNYAVTEQGKYNLAAAAQWFATEQITNLMLLAKELVDSSCLVYSGGVALNCVANAEVSSLFEKTWIMPNPGDAGNSLGAVANYLQAPLNWTGPFLGYDIKRPLNITGILDELETTGICGVATGRAEFGPRALGNRSLLADPRRSDIKDKVNEIKRRQKFRPFAPAILESFAKDYFTFPANVTKASYMQYVVEVKNPSALPAVSHFDGTARVQTVGREAPVLAEILTEWFMRTGCPVLLNTSLNIKGEPLVNTEEDAARWEKQYRVKVF